MLPAFLEGSARPAPPDVPHKQLPRANKVSAWLQLAAHRRRLNAWHRAGRRGVAGAWSGRGPGSCPRPEPHRTPWLQQDHAPPLPRPRPLQSGGRVKTFIGCFLAQVGGGTPFFQQGQLLAEAPPCPHLSLPQRHQPPPSRDVWSPLGDLGFREPSGRPGPRFV